MAWEDYKDLDVTREEEIVKEDEKTQRIELQRKSPFDKPINKGGELIGLKKILSPIAYNFQKEIKKLGSFVTSEFFVYYKVITSYF